MYSPSPHLQGNNAPPVSRYRSSDSAVETGQTLAYCHQQAAFIPTGYASYNGYPYSGWSQVAPGIQEKISRPIQPQAQPQQQLQQQLLFEQLLFSYQQQRMLLLQQQHRANAFLQSASRSCVTIQSRQCCPVQTQGPVRHSHQQAVQLHAAHTPCNFGQGNSQPGSPRYALASGPHPLQHGTAAYSQNYIVHPMIHCQGQAYLVNKEGQMKGQMNSAPAGAQNPMAWQSAGYQHAWPCANSYQPNSVNGFQCVSAPASEQPEETAKLPEAAMQLQNMPSTPDTAEDKPVRAHSCPLVPTVATAKAEVTTVSDACNDPTKTPPKRQLTRSRVSFAVPPLPHEGSDDDLTPDRQADIAEVSQETRISDEVCSPRCTGKNIPSHSLDDLLDGEDEDTDAMLAPKTPPKRLPSRKGSRPQLLALRKSAAYSNSGIDSLYNLRGGNKKFHPPLDPSIFATEEDDKAARIRRHMDATHSALGAITSVTKAAADRCSRPYDSRPKKDSRKVRKSWTCSAGSWGARETCDVERKIEDLLAKGFTVQEVLESTCSLFRTEMSISRRMNLPKKKRASMS